ncbi:hypothetical protein [Sphingomonas qomolangmaensis]|uniref:hypothetical protein n=1 Tax=Sphingomonas qomolangmaensis TaxID=2918765 RepID=UPI0029E81FEC|nr:hypothetical protein [Sphingomonas qomolangmaensis]
MKHSDYRASSSYAAAAPAVEPPLISVPELDSLQPIETIKRRWPRILGAALSLAMIVGLGFELFGEGLAALQQAVPTHPGFYIAFLILYMSPPTFDYVIFRRLWGIPLEGMMALHKKRIANEVVIGYSGEAYFYAWARARMKMVAAPFGAVKDVTILSAIAGNGITLLMIGLALPFGATLLTENQFETLLGSAAVIVATSLPFLLFSRRVFSLPRPTLWWVFGVHCLRLLVGSTMIGLAWHFAMPDVSVGMWLFLAAGRLLVSRLPLVPNKDLLFANFAIILIGQGEALSELIAVTAAMVLLLHGVLIGLFGIHALIRNPR